MKEIQLTKGLVTIVDDEDFEELSKFKWHAQGKPLKNYAVRKVSLQDGRQGCELLHRRLMGLSPDDPRQVDHSNHSRLDNRRPNLRVVTARQNGENRRDQGRYGPGICRSRRGAYEARAWVGGRNHHIGTFETPEGARKARRRFLCSL